MARIRKIVLLVSVLSVAAAHAFGQSAVPTTSIPDFPGMWAHASIPGFEPLASGPTSLTNRSRRNGLSNLAQLVGDYTNPVLKPEAAEIVKQHGQMSLTGFGYPTPRNQCWPGGVPFVLPTNGLQIFQQNGRITIVYAVYHQVRRVRMNDRHPVKLTPSWYGDSVGHYEGGDTLVVDTIGLNDKTFVDGYRTPHTTQLHVVERFRVVKGGKGLDVSFTVDDPGTFYKPWGGRRPRYLVENRPLSEGDTICAAGNQDRFNLGFDPVPHADTPDF